MKSALNNLPLGNAGMGERAPLTSGPKVYNDLSSKSEILTRGPNTSFKLPAASYSSTWPMPQSTLDLDFVNNRGWVRGVGQGRAMDAVTFTRASTATFVGSDGLIQTAANGIPRFEYDPVTLAPKGLLIEEARANLFPQSEFASGVSGTGLVTASTMTGPSGTTIAAAAFGYDGTTSAYVYKGTVAASTQYAITVYVRMDDGLAPTFGSSSGSSPLNDFVLVVGNSGVSPLTYTVTHVGSGLYKVSAVITSATNLNVNGVLKYSTNSNRTFKTSAWQVEAGAFPTSYIPTTTGSVVRSADVVTMSGQNFFGWYNQGRGTFYTSADTFTPSSVGGTIFTISDGGINNRIMVYLPGAWTAYIVVGGATQAFINLSGFQQNATAKIALAVRPDSFAASIGNTLGTEDTSGNLPIANILYIGQTSGNLGQLNGHIGRLVYIPARLNNSILQAITGSTL